MNNEEENKTRRHKLALEIFHREGDGSLIVFLCGKDFMDKTSIREKIRSELTKYIRVKIAYPELIFSDGRAFADDDLLELEKKLADWVDVVAIPLESPATLVELGAFCALPVLLGKVAIFNHIEHKGKRNFINLGPVKAISRRNKSNVNYYSDSTQQVDIERFAKFLAEKKKTVDHKDLSNIFNLSRLVRAVIAIWQPIDRSKLSLIVREIYKEREEKYLNACIENLLSTKHVQTKLIGSKEHLLLTPLGYTDYIASVERCSALRRHVESRAQTMRATYIRRKEFRGGGAMKLLDLGNTVLVRPSSGDSPGS